MLAVLDKDADHDRRMDGALLIAQALSDIYLIRTALFTTPLDD